MIIKALRTSVVLFAAFTGFTGFLYPLIVTAAAQLLFPSGANGSRIEMNGRLFGSRLVGQAFSSPGYFWSRPSVTSPTPYNGAASSGSNLGPSNPAFLDQLRRRINTLREADPGNNEPVPVDLVTASGSGLDPHISVAAALYQLPRVARARGLPEEKIRSMLNRHVEGRQFEFLGEPRVNVLLLNLDLDAAEHESEGDHP